MPDSKLYLCKGYKIKKISKKIIFYHVPKCGGTTFCNILSNITNSSARIQGSPTGERETNSAYNNFITNKNLYLKKNIDFIFGHFQYSISEYFPKRLSITILRDPIERCISHFNMVVERKYVHKNTSIETCFKKNLIPSNIIAQIFSGMNNNDINISERKLNIASDIILNKIDLVFDIQYINELLNMVISLYNLPNIFFQKLQQTRKNYFVSNAKNIEIIKKYNEYDIELYSLFKKNNKRIVNKNSNFKRKKNDYFLYVQDFKINNNYRAMVNIKHFHKIEKMLLLKNLKIIEI